jgi:hypothetical protein
MSLSKNCRLLPALCFLVLSANPAVAAVADPAPAGQPATLAQTPEPQLSELRLDASLIDEFVQSIFFADQGRYHFREYSKCSYEFLQNPSVVVEEGVVSVTADYWRRSAAEVGGACVGGPGMNTNVTMSARLAARGSAVAIEVFEVETESLASLTSTILQLAGVTLPMTTEFDLLGALNGLLYEKQPFGIVSLDIREVVAENNSVLLRLTMRLGIW